MSINFYTRRIGGGSVEIIDHLISESGLPPVQLKVGVVLIQLSHLKD
jgi:hypothetical protein